MRPSGRVLARNKPWALRRDQRYARRLEERRAITEPFMLPSHVLDLDSESNPYVREFNDQDEQEQRVKWAQDRALDAMKARFDSKHARTLHAMRDWCLMRDEPYDAGRITPCDVVMATIPPAEHRDASGRSWPDVDFRMLADKNAIPKDTSNQQETALYMLDRLLEQRVTGRWHDTVESARGFSAALHRAQRDLAQPRLEARRLLFELVWQAEVNNEKDDGGGPRHIHSSLDAALGAFKVEDAGEVLTMVNNLSSHLSSKGIRPTRKLCYMGLEASAACLQFWTSQRYLEEGQRLGYFASTRGASSYMEIDAPPTSDIVKRVLTRVVDNMPTILKADRNWRRIGERPRRSNKGMGRDGAVSSREVVAEGDSGQQNLPPAFPGASASASGRNVRSELFTFLTGYSLVKPGAQASIRDFLPASEIHTTAEASDLYLHILRELGATRTVWHECQPRMTADSEKLEGANRPPNVTGEFLRDVALDLEEISLPLPAEETSQTASTTQG